MSHDIVLIGASAGGVQALSQVIGGLPRDRVVGVVLTGNLDDGTAGLAAIKQRGGIAVVQDPDEADYPGMPSSAIQNVLVDHILPLHEIAPLIDRLARQPLPEGDGDPPPSAAQEEPDAMSTEPEDEGEAAGAREGQASGFTCPDCGGALWEKPGGPLHFRCRTGHAYSPETLFAKQADNLEQTLWAAVRALEENAAFARRMEKRMRQAGSDLASTRYERRAQAAEAHADVLRRVLYAEEKKVADG